MIFKNSAHFKMKLNALIAAAVRRGNPYPPGFHPKRHFVPKNEKFVSFPLVTETSYVVYVLPNIFPGHSHLTSNITAWPFHF